MKKRVAILFDNFGPYHLARLKAASEVGDLLAVEFGAYSSEYDWEASRSEGFKRVVVNQSGSSRELTQQEFQRQLSKILNDFHTDVVVVPGWGFRGALMALGWCFRGDVPAVVMSESTAWDAERNPIKEWVKARIVSLFSSALVGGTPHRVYMEQLGLPKDHIFLGYDAVDNSFFKTEGERLRNVCEATAGLAKAKGESNNTAENPRPYFLASARFIEKKNLFRLLKAYALYRKEVKSAVDGRVSSVEGSDSGTSAFSLQPLAFDLVLLGDGQLRPDLCRLISDLGLQECVQLPGFKQYNELPSYYAAAGAFIHASTTEQWGLVVNEAMASGLPVLVSNRCGCAADLVQDGVNGWTFDPADEERLAELMLKISSDEALRSEMGVRSSEIIARWGPDRFASGLSDAVQAALSVPRKKPGILNRLILWAMTRR